jgi:O-antigen/teichoic acid export membrane protein
MSSGTSGRSFVSSAAILTLAQYVAAGVGFLTTLVTARWLGSEAFGAAAVIMAYPLAISAFTGVKTATVTQRYVSGFRSTNKHSDLLAVCKFGFVTDFAFALLATVVVVASVWFVGDFPGTDGDGSLVVIFALSVPLTSFLGTTIVVMLAFDRHELVAALQVLNKLAVLIAVFLALAIRAETAALVVGTAVGQAVSGLIYLASGSALLHRAVGTHWWRAPGTPLRRFGRELRSLLGWSFLGVTLAGAMIQVPVLLLGAIRSPVEAGYFRLASTIAVTVDAVEAAMSRVAYSALASAEARNDVHRLHQLIVSWSRREARLGVAAVLLGMAALPVLTVVALGDEYTDMIAGAEALLLGTAVSTAFFFTMPYLYSTGRVRLWVMAYGAYALIALGAGSALAETSGFTGFAAVIGGGLALLNIVVGLPILRRARRMVASPAQVAPASVQAGPSG